jgi:hypothetical protein
MMANNMGNKLHKFSSRFSKMKAAKHFFFRFFALLYTYGMPSLEVLPDCVIIIHCSQWHWNKCSRTVIVKMK